MLRTAVLVCGLLVAGIGALLLLVRPADGLPALLFGGLLVIATVFERWRYKWTVAAGKAQGEPTGERFVDPASGKLVEVYYESSTGKRSYVEIDRRDSND